MVVATGTKVVRYRRGVAPARSAALGRDDGDHAADTMFAPWPAAWVMPNAAMTLRVYAHVVQAADEALAAGLGDALNGDA